MTGHRENDPAPLPDDSEEARRSRGRQLAMDEILKLTFSSTNQTERPARLREITAGSNSRLSGFWLRTASLAAVFLLTVAGLLFLFRPIPEEQQVALTPRNIAPQSVHPPAIDPGPMFPPSPIGDAGLPDADVVGAGEPGSASIFEVAGRRILPIGDAQFSVDGLGNLKLDRGELRVSASTTTAHKGTLKIATPLGTAESPAEAEFFIGTHQQNSVKENTMNSFKALTRVLILTGIVTLTTSDGTLTGTSGHLLAATPGAPPEDIAVQANNGFAVSLYQQLAKSSPDQGLFFSPYSLSLALAMTAEGARGETAEEMARVLNLSEKARRVGADAQVIPFNFALMHAGYHSISRRLTRSNASDDKTRQRIGALRQQLAEANSKAEGLMKAQKYQAARSASGKAESLADELNSLLSQVDRFDLRVANALWGEKTYPFRREYLSTIDQYYGTGSIFPMDFRNDSGSARMEINRWAAENTGNLIPELIGPNVMSPSDWQRVRLVLTNAIYFRGEWSEIFPEALTKSEPFLLSKGKTIDTQLMHSHAMTAGYTAFNADGSVFETPAEVPISGDQPQVYPDDSGFALLEMAYKGDKLSMVVLAPRSPDGLKAIEAMVTAENLQQWTAAAKSRNVETFMPRFKMNKSIDVSASLKALGIQRAFTALGDDSAEFDGMYDGTDPGLKLYISNVLHAAQVDVNEKGTEAAAATAVIMPAPRAIIPLLPFVPVFRADRPFLFLIRDRESGAILFMGRMTNPAA